ncbi:hypothetical protein DFP79_0583 [Marinomonas balearica]|uniref:Uncharacterized protein n=1 Tax=Marinomonas balearica TaxID=491947 RepID=A0A4R6MD36_9GAMM|nr:hypothetical protein DFP79_0583 [Marinomonas balearica]
MDYVKGVIVIQIAINMKTDFLFSEYPKHRLTYFNFGLFNSEKHWLNTSASASRYIDITIKQSDGRAQV